MARYTKEDILGLDLGDGKIVCQECAGDEEWDNMTEEQIIVEDEDQIVFCGRYKKKL